MGMSNKLETIIEAALNDHPDLTIRIRNREIYGGREVIVTSGGHTSSASYNPRSFPLDWALDCAIRGLYIDLRMQAALECYIAVTGEGGPA